MLPIQLLRGGECKYQEEFSRQIFEGSAQPSPYLVMFGALFGFVLRTRKITVLPSFCNCTFISKMLPFTDFIPAGAPLSAFTFSVGNLPTIRDVYAQYVLTGNVSDII